MTAKTSTMARRNPTTGMLAVLGAAITGATWVGAEHSLAIAMAGLYLLSCAVSYLWSRGSGDVAAIIRLSGDERQPLIDIRATAAAAGLATIAFCLGGAMVNLASWATGSPWTLICAVSGLSCVLAVGVFRQSLSRAGRGGYLSAAFPEHPLRQKPVAQPSATMANVSVAMAPRPTQIADPTAARAPGRHAARLLPRPAGSHRVPTRGGGRGVEPDQDPACWRQVVLG
jgi:hypothetical protein